MLAADQEWCLNCGAAAGTEVVEARGWRVPLYLGGGLAALAVIGVILAIVALASRNDVVAGDPTPTPSASAVPPGATADGAAAGDDHAAAEHDGGSAREPDDDGGPERDADGEPDGHGRRHGEPDGRADGDRGPEHGHGTGSTFPDWTGADGDYTIIIESAKSRSGAEKVAQKAQDAGLTDVGILDSGNYSSLNGGYQVVFTGVVHEQDGRRGRPERRAVGLQGRVRPARSRP